MNMKLNLNDAKRRIKLLKKDYHKCMISDMRSIMKYKNQLNLLLGD